MSLGTQIARLRRRVAERGDGESAPTRRGGLRPPRVKLLARKGRLRIYRVIATEVRKLRHLLADAPDFTMGTNDAVWPEITGPNQVFISDELAGTPEETATMVHELRERRRMLRDGLSYDDAHQEALELEDYYRQRNWRGLAAALRRELKAA